MEVRKFVNDGSRQAELSEFLAKLNQAYRNETTQVDDITYDKLYEELKSLEEKNGFKFDNSPVDVVGAAPSSNGRKKVKHKYPALSLDKYKIKDLNLLISKWMKTNDSVLSWKCDGDTLILNYKNGTLVLAETRGGGEIGDDVTDNMNGISGIPKTIPYTGELIVRGECMMTFEDFDKINAENPGKYKNPRNAASGRLSMLDTKTAGTIPLIFKAFSLVYPLPENENVVLTDGIEFSMASEISRFDFMSALGFDVVEHQLLTRTGDKAISDEDVSSIVFDWEKKIEKLPFPTDGLVFTYNDAVMGASLGMTEHHARNSMALKWSDETKEATVDHIEYSLSRTGLLTPVVVTTRPVKLGLGSSVQRASLHNLSVMKKIPKMGDNLQTVTVGKGSKVALYLAQAIIPQVAEATDGDPEIPSECPVCHGPVVTEFNNNTETLWCKNPDCPVKHEKNIERFFGKDGCTAKGLGESQISDLLNTKLATTSPLSFLKLKETYGDKLPDALKKMDGWGQLKWKNILKSLTEARETTLRDFLYALGIPMLGHDLSKKLNKLWKGNPDEFMRFYEDPDASWLLEQDNIGPEKADALITWCSETSNDKNKDKNFRDLFNFMHFNNEIEESHEQTFSGTTFVITGDVHIFANRNAFKKYVEDRGGKVSGSVSKKTSYLVINDLNSTSSKAETARTLNIPMLSEDQFMMKFQVNHADINR